MAPDPDAVADEMPRSALSAVTAALAVPSARIGDVLSDLVEEPAGPGMPVPPDIRLEVDIAAGERIDSGILTRIADPAALTCPHCGGMWVDAEDLEAVTHEDRPALMTRVLSEALEAFRSADWKGGTRK